MNFLYRVLLNGKVKTLESVRKEIIAEKMILLAKYLRSSGNTKTIICFRTSLFKNKKEEKFPAKYIQK